MRESKWGGHYPDEHYFHLADRLIKLDYPELVEPADEPELQSAPAPV